LEVEILLDNSIKWQKECFLTLECQGWVRTYSKDYKDSEEEALTTLGWEA
jgi:hypothetical protein